MAYDEVFLGAELGPDGRIYVVHQGISYSTVQYPNVRGKAAKFIEGNPYFGVVIGAAIPYLPAYRLGPLDGSPCDTLGLNNIPVANYRVDDTSGVWSRYFYDLSHHEPATWLWDFGDGSTSSDTSVLHTYAQPGIYTVCLTVSNINGSHTLCREVYVGVSAAAEPLRVQHGVRVSPNPARDYFEISLPDGIAVTTLSITDPQGRSLRDIQIPAATLRWTVPTEGLPNGTYFLRFRSATLAPLSTQKLVILR